MELVKKLILIPAAVLVFAGCNQTPAETPAEDAMMEQSEVMENESVMEGEAMMEGEGETMMKEMMVADGETIDVAMSAFKYDPNVIKATAGSTITLNLQSADMPHDFVIDELNVQSSQLLAGETETIEVVIPQSAAGQSYEFYCSVGNHREQGMVGTLMVE